MNYSPKLAKKYQLSTMIISVNRCLMKQKPLKEKQKKRYNLRCLHQLYININRYDFAHNWTIFNYEFLSAYLLCGEYKISDLLYQFSIGAHDPNGELRFLFKQFESSSDILDQYPNNLSFELIYRLSPFRNYLPELTYNLLEQSCIHCPLQLVTDNERKQYLGKYSLSNIVCLTIDSHRVFVLTNNQKLYFFHYNYYTLSITHQFDIIYNKKEANEKLLSFLCEFPYVCCLSSNSSMIVMNCQTKQVSMQIPCRKLISFINQEIILIISSLNNSLELWNCSTNLLISEYHSEDNLIKDCRFKNSIIKIIFEQNSMISYFSFDKNFQFNSIRILQENFPNSNHHILLDIHTEFYYSSHHSQASLMIYHEQNSKEIINNIEFHSLPKSVIYLPQSNAIAWLTSTSLMLFHPLHKEKIYKPFQIISSIDYDVIHDHYSSLEFSDQTNFLACMNKIKQTIDIYEWRYDTEQQKHIHRQLTHLQLDININEFVFTAKWFDGITIYCSDDSNIYKYNATMLTYLTSSKPFISSQIIDQIPSIHSDEYIVLNNSSNLLKILKLNDNNTFEELNLSIDLIKNYYLTKTSSHILVINEKNILVIYSLKTSEFLWRTNEFQYENLQIHSLQSSFILICLQTKNIFLIDTNSFELKKLIQLSNNCLLSTITSNNRLYIISNDQTTLIEFDINNQNLTILPAIQLNSTKIIQLHSVIDSLVFHTDDNQIHLWRKENNRITKLEKSSRFISKDTRLVLVCTDNKTLILYDLKEKLRGIIQLDNDAGECEALHLSDNKQDEQYLFLICQDRFLRMYCVSNGKQVVKLFIQRNLYPFIGILNNRLILKVNDHLCLIKIIEKKSLTKKLSNIKCPLFEQSMWMICHHDHCVWS